MKKIFSISFLPVMILFFNSCSKKVDYNADYTPLSAKNDSRLKIIYASAYATNPGVHVVIDDIRVSGVILGRTPFPGGGFNTNGLNSPDFLKLDSGNHSFRIAIPKVGTNVDSVVLYNSTFTLAAGRTHTLHIMDTFTRTKSLLTEEDVSRPVNKIRYRFVNLMPNVPRLDLYYGTLLVATGVQYNTPGVVFELPGNVVSAAWNIRETGTSPTSTVLATYTSGNTIVNERVYTAFAMGYKGTALPANTRAYISFAINK